jgi:hypothetical protein
MATGDHLFTLADARLRRRRGLGRVNDRASPINMPLSHPLYRLDVAADVADADTILLLDCLVPWIPKLTQPPETARIAQIDETDFSQ